LEDQKPSRQVRKLIAVAKGRAKEQLDISIDAHVRLTDADFKYNLSTNNLVSCRKTLAQREETLAALIGEQD
jgi:hypothetical protein